MISQTGGATTVGAKMTLRVFLVRIGRRVGTKAVSFSKVGRRGFVSALSCLRFPPPGRATRHPRLNRLGSRSAGATNTHFRKQVGGGGGREVE